MGWVWFIRIHWFHLHLDFREKQEDFPMESQVGGGLHHFEGSKICLLALFFPSQNLPVEEKQHQ